MKKNRKRRGKVSRIACRICKAFIGKDQSCIKTITRAHTITEEGNISLFTDVILSETNAFKLQIPNIAYTRVFKKDT